jgi:hypothetical protein
MMEGSASISAFLSPPLSLSGLSPQSNFNYVQLDDNAFTADDGTTYCIYDPNAAYQIVYQPVGIADNENAITFAFADAGDDGQDGQPTDPAESTSTQEAKVFQFALESESTKSEQNVTETGEEIQVKNELSGEYMTTNEPEVTESAEEPPELPSTALPTFYHDMAVALSNDSETHETYLPLTFDEASHFLFHGREECVITTDIPTVETSSFASSTTSNNSFDSNISQSSARKKAKPLKRPRLNEGLIINRKVFKCPYRDCTFWVSAMNTCA